MNVTIYKVTSPSNKVYVGISSDFEKRKRSHINNALNPNCKDYSSKFKSAIRKYGSLLIWEVIDIAKDYETAFELEKRYILHFDSYNNGYNITTGGEGLTYSPKWSKNKLRKEALLYKTRNEWKTRNRSSYQRARNIAKSDILFWNDITSHMSTCHKSWTKITIELRLKELNLKSIIEWKDLDRSSYEAAKNMKDKEWYKSIKRVFFNKELVLKS